MNTAQLIRWQVLIR